MHSLRRCIHVATLAALLPLSAFVGRTAYALQQPMRIVLTNDDGIEEVEARLLPVAERLREFAEVYIVVSDQDRSGTSNILAVSRAVSLESRLEYRSEATQHKHLLEVHVVNGYPADCVIVGAFGLLQEQKVDLVISGPNGGSNLADGWFGSGTIGAARAAAYLGLPSVAVSGLDSDSSDQVAALADWIARVAQSDAIRQLPQLTYLTIAVPRVPPDQIRGIRIARRDHVVSGFDVSRVARLQRSDDEVTSVWTVQAETSDALIDPEGDISLYEGNWVVVTPMRVDEHAEDLLRHPDSLQMLLPDWSHR